jgi:hypothetical protein
MWRMISRLVPATLTATLAFIGLTAPEADASAVQSFSYTTDGTVANQSGVAPISFIGTGPQTFTTPGTFALGQFEAANILPASATLTYNNTPFTIDLNVPSATGTGIYTFVISGFLNGSITGSGTSDMVATVSSITGVPSDSNGTMTTPPFSASEIQINVPQGITAPNALTGTTGFTTLFAQVSPGLGGAAPAPEPTSIAVFGVGLVAWGIRRRMVRSKSQVTA